VRIGDTMSVKGLVYIDGQVAVGSALSLRAFARLGSYLSVFGVMRLGSSLSVLDYAQVGSALSIRSWARLGSSVSVMCFGHMGSSLSLRSFARFGSTLSVFGAVRVGNTLSCLHNLLLGSGLHFGGTSTYIAYHTGSSELRFHAGGAKRMSLTTTGGSLHGTWSSESIISASDRRLKHKVEPLYRALAGRMNPVPAPPPAPAESPSSTSLFGGASAQPPAAAGSTLSRSQSEHARKSGATVDWLLRELRPVSFKFREGAEAKGTRYGFVAQEVEKILPEMVREKDQTKFVVYQDMVAVLTLASQVQQERLASSEERARVRSAVLDKQAQRMSKLQRGVAALNARMSRWEKLARKSRRPSRRPA